MQSINPRSHQLIHNLTGTRSLADTAKLFTVAFQPSAGPAKARQTSCAAHVVATSIFLNGREALWTWLDANIILRPKIEPCLRTCDEC